jgi:hypothetical protein
VLGDIPRYVRHVRGTPREDFGVCAEKVDEHCFLFGVELGADLDFLSGVVAGVERDRLDRLNWFEVVGVPLRVRRLLGEAPGGRCLVPCARDEPRLPACVGTTPRDAPSSGHMRT